MQLKTKKKYKNFDFFMTVILPVILLILGALLVWQNALLLLKQRDFVREEPLTFWTALGIALVFAVAGILFIRLAKRRAVKDTGYVLVFIGLGFAFVFGRYIMPVLAVVATSAMLCYRGKRQKETETDVVFLLRDSETFILLTCALIVFVADIIWFITAFGYMEMPYKILSFAHLIVAIFYLAYTSLLGYVVWVRRKVADGKTFRSSDSQK